MKKKSPHKKLRLVLAGQTIRDLRNLTPQELEQAIGAVGCSMPATSNAEDICTTPH